MYLLDTHIVFWALMDSQAPAQIEGLTLLTADTKVQRMGAPWLW